MNEYSVPVPRAGARVERIAGIAARRWDLGAAPSQDLETLGLVDKALNGDRDAFGELYVEYRPAVYRLARLYLDGSADDVVAETFVRAWWRLPSFSRDAPFGAWLYGIARHVIADEIRFRRRLLPLDPLPEGAIESDEDDRLELASAIARLPEAQRRVIELKYLIGLSNHEVAAALGKSAGAVNAQQWRALKNLKRMLETT